MPPTKRIRERFSMSNEKQHKGYNPATANMMASNYQTTMSKAQTVLEVTDENYGSTEQ